MYDLQNLNNQLTATNREIDRMGNALSRLEADSTAAIEHRRAIKDKKEHKASLEKQIKELENPVAAPPVQAQEPAPPQDPNAPTHPAAVGASEPVAGDDAGDATETQADQG